MGKKFGITKVLLVRQCPVIRLCLKTKELSEKIGGVSKCARVIAGLTRQDTEREQASF